MFWEDAHIHGLWTIGVEVELVSTQPRMRLGEMSLTDFGRAGEKCEWQAVSAPGRGRARSARGTFKWRRVQFAAGTDPVKA